MQALPNHLVTRRVADLLLSSDYLKHSQPLFYTHSMNEDNIRYSREDLNEFDQIIQEKLTAARKELSFIKETLNRSNDSGTDTTASSAKVLEDGADTAEKESMNQLASRQMKFIQQLENAQVRIKNGTYGVCIGTGKLIPKERLRAVPHTQHSIEAKMARRD
jgi:RNA polymerase-binding transcription factor DksA